MIGQTNATHKIAGSTSRRAESLANRIEEGAASPQGQVRPDGRLHGTAMHFLATRNSTRSRSRVLAGCARSKMLPAELPAALSSEAGRDKPEQRSSEF